MKLINKSKKNPKRKFGVLKGKIKIANDFDSPLPEKILKEFEINNSKKNYLDL